MNIKKLIREELELSNIVEKALSPKDRKKAKDDGLVHFGRGIWGKKKDKVKGKKKKGSFVLFTDFLPRNKLVDRIFHVFSKIDRTQIQGRVQYRKFSFFRTSRLLHN